MPKKDKNLKQNLYKMLVINKSIEMSMILLNLMFPEEHTQEMSSHQKHLNLFFNHHLKKRTQLLIQKEWIPGYTEQQLIILIDFHNGMIL